MISDAAALRLLKDLDKADEPLYVFMDEDEKVLACEWINNDNLAVRYAELLQKRAPGIINVLRYVGAAE